MMNQDTPLLAKWTRREVVSPEDSLSLVQGFAICTTVSTAFQAAVVTFFFYYCALHFGEEVEFIWSRPWTRGKAIYILSRYSGSIFLILIFTGLLPIRWNEAGGRVLNGDGRLELLAIGSCFGGYLYVVAGTTTILLAEVILAMRLYALYERKKRIIVLSVLLMAISVASTQLLGAIYTIKPETNCIGKPCILSNNETVSYRISMSCPMASITVTVIGWVPTSFVELIFLVLVIWKIRKMQQIRRKYGLVANDGVPHAVDITGVMARDSKKYFVKIFLICFIGACFSIISWIVVDKYRGHSIAILIAPALSNAFLTFAIAALSILAPELFISLRMESCGPVGSLADRSQLSWDVAVSGSPNVEYRESGSPGRGRY